MKKERFFFGDKVSQDGLELSLAQTDLKPPGASALAS